MIWFWCRDVQKCPSKSALHRTRLRLAGPPGPSGPPLLLQGLPQQVPSTTSRWPGGESPRRRPHRYPFFLTCSSLQPTLPLLTPAHGPLTQESLQNSVVHIPGCLQDLLHRCSVHLYLEITYREKKFSTAWSLTYLSALFTGGITSLKMTATPCNKPLLIIKSPPCFRLKIGKYEGLEASR